MLKVDADTIAKRIKELPPLPLVVQKLLEVVGDTASSAKDLTKALSTDQALAGKVLRLVNSSFYGFPGKISTLNRAVVILGYNAIRNLALALSAYDALKKVRGPVKWEEFWGHAITCAAASQILAQSVRYSEPEEAFIAGLLHDIGFFIQNMADPERFAEMAESGLAGNLEAETEFIGANHAEIGIRLMEHWKLPEPLCRVARFHHSVKHAASGEHQLVGVVALADILSGIKGNGYVERSDYATLPQISAALGISLEEYNRILGEVDSRVRDAKAFLNIAEEQPPSAGQLDREEIYTVVVVSADTHRRGWVEALLRNFGYHVVSTSALTSAAPDKEQVRQVLLDPLGLERGPMEKLAAALRAGGMAVAFLDDGGAVPEGYPSLPFVFDRERAARLIKERA